LNHKAKFSLNIELKPGLRLTTTGLISSASTHLVQRQSQGTASIQNQPWIQGIEELPSQLGVASPEAATGQTQSKTESKPNAAAGSQPKQQPTAQGDSSKNAKYLDLQNFPLTMLTLDFGNILRR